LNWSCCGSRFNALDLPTEHRLVGDSVGGAAAIVSGQSQQQLALLQVLELFSVVVFASFNSLWIGTLSREFVSSDPENGSDWASVFTWAVVQANVVFSTVFRVSVTGESSWIWVG